MKSLYVAASGMSAQQTRLDNVANNIANVSTTGFKKTREAFQDLFYQELTAGGQGASTARVEVGGGVALAALQKQHTNGSLVQTGDPLNLAIQGEGMFVLEDAQGQPVYSRDGDFKLDADGLMVNNSGLRVGGDILVPDDADRSSILILEDGTIQAVLGDDNEYTTLGQIELATFVNPEGLASVGHNLYQATPESGDPMLPDDGEMQLVQGYVEGSNVDVAEELITMIQAQRAYELNSKVVQAADEAMSVAANLRR